MAYEITGVNLQQFAHPFGFSLYEMVKPVVAFRVDITDRVRIKNIVKLTTKDVPTPTAFLFHLIEGEYVKSVHSAMQNCKPYGVQFQTNLRTSLWIGERRPADTVSVVRAGPNQAIHSLCGTASGPLGAVLWPIEAVTGGSATNLAPESSLVRDKHVIYSFPSGGRSIGTDVKEIRAVVVSMTATAVSALCVLSSDEYQRYLAMIDVVQLPRSDHVVELIQGETIVKVDCVCNEQALQAIRFTTTRRATPWFGSQSGQRLTSTKVEAPNGAHISGLFGLQARGTVREVGVVVARPIDQAVLDSNPESASTTRTEDETEAVTPPGTDSTQAWEIMDDVGRE